MSRVVTVLLTLCLAACGTKAPLRMPDRPTPEPLLGNAKPAASQPATIAPNVSTATKTNTANPQ